MRSNCLRKFPHPVFYATYLLSFFLFPEFSVKITAKKHLRKIFLNVILADVDLKNCSRTCGLSIEAAVCVTIQSHEDLSGNTKARSRKAAPRRLWTVIFLCSKPKEEKNGKEYDKLPRRRKSRQTDA
jgi:hypothetical protein